LPIADCRLPIEDLGSRCQRDAAIFNRQSATFNRQSER